MARTTDHNIQEISTMTLRVAAVNITYFFEFRKTDSGHYEGIGGIEFEFLKILSTALMFAFQLVSPSDHGWGNLLDNGSWTGIMGMLQRNTADIAIVAIHPTIARMQVADFSFPYAIDRNKFAMTKAGMASKEFVYMYSFPITVWAALLVSLLLCSTLLVYMQRLKLNRRKRQKHINIFSAAELLLGYRDANCISQQLSFRILVATTGLSMQVMKYCFVGVFLSLLMNPVMDPQITTIKELVEASRKGTHRVTVMEGVTLEAELKTAKNGTFKDLGENLRKYPETVFTDGNMIARIMEGYVVLNAGNYLKMKTEVSGLGSKIFLSEDGLNIMTSAIAFRKNFCCINTFNKIISKIQQGGLYKKIIDDHIFYLFSKIQNKDVEIDTHAPRPISLKDLAGIFWVMFAGYLLAFIELLFENYIWKTRTHLKIN